MIIAQITDLHVVARDRLCYQRVPTNAQLVQAVAHINSLDPKPDAVVASGDLTDQGVQRNTMCCAKSWRS
jgi:3',5'-cyclic-AMP phosphodiesterase